MGDVFTRQPLEYNKSVFDFNEPMVDEKQKEKLKQLFNEFIVPFTDKALSKSGIKGLADRRETTLLPAIQEELLATKKGIGQKYEE